MSWLALNGMSVPVKFPSATRQRERHGLYMGRSFDGTGRQHHRTTKRSWRFDTVDMLEAAGEQLEGLLSGLGHRFSFETNLYSDRKALAPDTGYGGTISAVQAKLSSRSTYAASGVQTDYDFGYTGDYSVLVHHYIAAWASWCVSYNSDTTTLTKYKDGTTTSDTIGFLEWASGVLSLHGKNDTGGTDMGGDANNANVYYDELVVVPFQITSDLVTAYHNGGTGREFGSSPRLAMSGDVLLQEGPINVLAKIKNIRQVLGSGAAADRVLGRAISFELHEV